MDTFVTGMKHINNNHIILPFSILAYAAYKKQVHINSIYGSEFELGIASQPTVMCSCAKLLLLCVMAIVYMAAYIGFVTKQVRITI